MFPLWSKDAELPHSRRFLGERIQGKVCLRFVTPPVPFEIMGAPCYHAAPALRAIAQGALAEPIATDSYVTPDVCYYYKGELYAYSRATE